MGPSRPWRELSSVMLPKAMLASEGGVQNSLFFMLYTRYISSAREQLKNGLTKGICGPTPTALLIRRGQPKSHAQPGMHESCRRR